MDLCPTCPPFMHLSNKSSRSCRPWGKVMSSSPDSTPIIVFCSSVTWVIRATCSTKPAGYRFPSIWNMVSRGIEIFGTNLIPKMRLVISGAENYLAVNTEHVQSRCVCVWSVENPLEHQQDTGLQRSVVLWQEKRVKTIQLETRFQLHLWRRKTVLKRCCRTEVGVGVS